MEADYAAVWPVSLEVRQEGRELVGSFPYGETATRSDRGTVRKERFNRGAFDFALKDPNREINLLIDHSFGKPLASKRDGSLVFRDTPAALTFVATLPEESRQPSWVKDAVLATQAGLVGGLSPGFTVPPASVVQDAEVMEDEPGNPGVQVRVIRAAVLYEMSLVTRPSYKDSSIELRAEDTPTPPPNPFEAYRWL